jgi:hypothetical protein
MRYILSAIWGYENPSSFAVLLMLFMILVRLPYIVYRFIFISIDPMDCSSNQFYGLSAALF